MNTLCIELATILSLLASESEVVRNGYEYIVTDPALYGVIRRNFSANDNVTENSYCLRVTDGRDFIRRNLETVAFTMVDTTRMTKNFVFTGRDFEGALCYITVPDGIEKPDLHKYETNYLLVMPLNSELKHMGDNIPMEKDLYLRYNYDYLAIDGDTIMKSNLPSHYRYQRNGYRNYLYIGLATDGLDIMDKNHRKRLNESEPHPAVTLSTESLREDKCDGHDIIIIKFKLTNNTDKRFLSFIAYPQKPTEEYFSYLDYFTGNTDSEKKPDISPKTIRWYCDKAQKVTSGNMLLKQYESIEYIFKLKVKVADVCSETRFIWDPEFGYKTVTMNPADIDAVKNMLLQYIYLCPEDYIVEAERKWLRSNMTSLNSSNYLDEDNEDSKTYVYVLNPVE